MAVFKLISQQVSEAYEISEGCDTEITLHDRVEIVSRDVV